MRIIFFFLLSACIFAVTSCESTLDTSSIESEAQFRDAEPTPCMPELSENCAQDLINCTLRGSINPDAIGPGCIPGSFVIDPGFHGFPMSKFCACPDIDHHMEQILEAQELYLAEAPPCNPTTHAFSVTYYGAGNNGLITVNYQCCPSGIISTEEIEAAG